MLWSKKPMRKGMERRPGAPVRKMSRTESGLPAQRDHQQHCHVHTGISLSISQIDLLLPLRAYEVYFFLKGEPSNNELESNDPSH